MKLLTVGRSAFFIILTIVLSACGFHIRQYQNVSSEFRVLSVTSVTPHSSLKDLLVANLQGMGVSIESHAPVNITILSENFSQSKTVIGTAQQLNSVILTYTAVIVVKDASGNNILPPASFAVDTGYYQNASQILGDINSTGPLEQFLMRRMSQKILSYLNARESQHALSAHH